MPVCVKDTCLLYTILKIVGLAEIDRTSELIVDDIKSNGNSKQMT